MDGAQQADGSWSISASANKGKAPENQENRPMGLGNKRFPGGFSLKSRYLKNTTLLLDVAVS